ncbi:MAG: hypothetical protein AAF226_18030, partial [Verrucomicrobiota bacterium]
LSGPALWSLLFLIVILVWRFYSSGITFINIVLLLCLILVAVAIVVWENLQHCGWEIEVSDSEIWIKRKYLKDLHWGFHELDEVETSPDRVVIRQPDLILEFVRDGFTATEWERLSDKLNQYS